ncbi:MAG: hypothetical protein U1G07_04775 [Verrucomicrobiota bacterium]
MSGMLAAGLSAARSTAKEGPVFREQGYYLCFMRMPTFDLGAWREILTGAAQD